MEGQSPPNQPSASALRLSSSRSPSFPGSTRTSPALTARFGPDDQILDLLEHGELDVAVTSITPGRRSLTSTPIGAKRFVLVGPPALAPPCPSNRQNLGSWLSGKPWVAFSAELPLTRRFWHSAFGRPFHADLRLVAPDLRVVAAAVAHGLGISLLPTFACRDALTLGSVVELHPVTDSMPFEPWFACTRVADLSREPLHRFISGSLHRDG